MGNYQASITSVTVGEWQQSIGKYRIDVEGGLTGDISLWNTGGLSNQFLWIKYAHHLATGHVHDDFGLVRGNFDAEPGTTYQVAIEVGWDGNSHVSNALEIVVPAAPAAPTVITDSPTHKSTTYLTLIGKITSGGSDDSVVFFRWGRDQNLNELAEGTVHGRVWHSPSALYIYNFHASLTGFTPGEKIYFKACASNGGLEGQGDVRNTTLQTPRHQPVVRTDPPQNVTETTADLYAEVLDDGGDRNGTKAFYWSQNESCLSADGSPDGYTALVGYVGATNKFMRTVENLLPDTTYYYRGAMTVHHDTPTNPFPETAIYCSYFADGSPPRQFRTSANVGTPTVTTNAATGVTHNAATLNGNVTNANNGTPTRYFRYGTSAGSLTQTATVGGTGAGAFNASISGLNANTTYHFRAYAANGELIGEGSTLSFITSATPAGVPTVTTNAATGVTHNAATLNGNVTNANNGTPTRYFRYGTSAGSLTQTATVGGTGAGTFNASISGLNANTTYHFRAYAANGELIGEGSTLSFITSATPAGVPTVTTNAATGVTHNAATLNGNVTNANNGTPTRYFRYGTSAGSLTQTATVGGTGAGTFNASISGLNANTTYHFRAYAANGELIGEGSTLSFITSATPAGVPTVTTNAATGVTHNAATLNGNVTNANNGTPTRYFRHGTSAGSLTQTATVGGTGAGTFNASISGLNANTTYHFRAYAANGELIGEGSTLSFITSATPASTPTVTTTPINNAEVTHSTAVLRGEVTNAGNGTPVRSMEYRIKSGGTTMTGGAGEGDVGPFSFPAGNLAASTVYEFRAVASNGTGMVGHGVWREFTTKDAPVTTPVVTTHAAKDIGINSATIVGHATNSGTNAANRRWFKYGLLSGALNQTTPDITGNASGDFECTFTDLQAERTYFYRAFAANGTNEGFGEELSFTTKREPSPPTIVTVKADEITDVSARLHGDLTDAGYPPELDPLRGMRWRVSGSTEWIPVAADSFAVGPFSIVANNLLPNRTYQYQAIAANGAGEFGGEIKTFQTSATPASKPAVITLAINNAEVTHNSAMLRGRITDAGNGSPSRAIEYRLEGTTSATTLDCGTGQVGDFGRATGAVLLSNQTYQFRATATNGAGLEAAPQGEWLVFKTRRASDDGIWVNIAGTLKVVK